MSKNVYFFGDGSADGNGKLRELLGGKGANLAEMSRIGLPVPAGFTITTEVCAEYYANNKNYPPSLEQEVENNLAKIEKSMGKKFGDTSNPLLVSVRSGARESMPGMMDTILNLGINDKVVQALSNKTGNEFFAWDSYRRFLQMYGAVVMGVEQRVGEHHDPFENILDKYKAKHGEEATDADLSVEDMQAIVGDFKTLIKERTGKNFPQEPRAQLWGAIGAVFNSWENDRAKVYRRKYNIPAEWGTAVNVQAMVFGNVGDDSGTGVAFTRNPANGKDEFYGEYLMNAQGEDVVAGVRTPKPVAEMAKDLPKPYADLLKVREKLEKHFRDVQDLEFTVENMRLFILQTRNGKRTGFAAVHIAIDLHEEGLISQDEVLARIPAEDLSHILAPIFEQKALQKANKIAVGLPAGPGAACGRIYFHADQAVEAQERGEQVILTRVETSPEDLRGMIAAEGILTSRGGVSSHAALVARQMGKVCVCGASELDINYEKAVISAGNVNLKEGDWISIDGTTGAVYAGEIATAPSEVTQALIDGKAEAKKSSTFQKFQKLMQWADEKRKLKVRVNADTPEQVESAIAFGAEGIGLCRTEHMFFEGDRIDVVREMILARSEENRKKAVNKLLPFQREDFIGVFTALNGLPATIRLLDPPLHEFLPHTKEQQFDLARKIGADVEDVIRRVSELHEFNPMLGHRGCRLGIVYPEITAMQVRAILEAAVEVKQKGIEPIVEIMVPLVGFQRELALQKEVVDRVAKEVMEEKGVKVDYEVGTMIEVPRACATADKIAQSAAFFSFGTNDLTQTGLGMSRDDSGSFLPAYQEAEIITQNPFATLDQNGVGVLVEMAVQKARAHDSKFKLGICGEHGGDPDSVKFFHKVGLNYVSCSPYRIPIAKLAAAQANL